MSVNHNYLTLDWDKVPYVNEQGSFEFLWELEDEDGSFPEWIQPVRFSDEIDDYRFSSWHGFMSFRDWFADAKSLMDPILVGRFSSLFQDIGLLMDDDFSFVPICRDVVVDDDWLLGAIPPEDLVELHRRSMDLNREAVRSEFQKALDVKPSDMYETGDAVAEWLDALRTGLDDVVKRRTFGIILGAA